MWRYFIAVKKAAIAIITRALTADAQKAAFSVADSNRFLRYLIDGLWRWTDCISTAEKDLAIFHSSESDQKLLSRFALALI